jgi:hypothetical protein
MIGHDDLTEQVDFASHHLVSIKNDMLADPEG